MKISVFASVKYTCKTRLYFILSFVNYSLIGLPQYPYLLFFLIVQ
nr:MAG TPA: hypothetical protein [Caudoviricetes sp.]